MKHYLLRRALVCVSSSLICALSSPALASTKVTIGPGDSIDSLARKYHVSKKEIARANGISTEAVLIDGKQLIIPDPPAHIAKSSSLRITASVKGDRIAVRRGPDSKYPRVTLLDRGAMLVVTAKHGEWSQIALENGSAGWMRSEFLKLGSPTLNGTTAGAGRIAHSARAVIAQQQEAERVAARARAIQARRDQIAANHRRRVRMAREGRRQRSRFAYSRSHSRREADAPRPATDVIRTAYAYRGVPYRYGGTSGRGFDCSGFTSTIYRKKGVSLPRTAAEQFHKGKRVDSSSMKQGDLVFFHTTRSGISHVGIYAGKGKFVHASSSGGRVRVDSLESGYYKNRFRGARRVSP